MSREFSHRFDGAEALDGLLSLCGCPLQTPQVLEQMQAAQRDGMEAHAFIPTLFDGEPRFPDPSYARQLFENLLGLWDLVAGGGPLRLTAKPVRKPKEKPPAPVRPPPFSGEPAADYVEAAWRYLEDIDERERRKLSDAFENRQDALLGFLDERGLSDDGYACARHLLFELFAMIELGWPPGVASVALGDLLGSGDVQPPAALAAYANEVLFEAEHDEEQPLRADELARVQDAVNRGLAALWKARRA